MTAFEFGSAVLDRARIIGNSLFYRFGTHCATHQIRVILISCVVITSLFYPALALYASSQTLTLSDSTSRILDTFLAPNTLPGFYVYAQHDLRNIWFGHSALRIRNDAVHRARCGLERTVRVERVLIQSPLTDDVGALNHQILLSTLRLEQRISNLMNSRGISCILTANGQCFVLSPLAFWNHSEEAVRSDPSILDTLSLSKTITISGVSVTPHMVLAGRRANENTGADFDFATFLALSYFIPENDCLGSMSHSAFSDILKLAARGEELVIQSQPSLTALEYDPSLSRNRRWSAISAFPYLAYTGLFAYVTWSMRRMDGVHSRVGLTFTALIEIAVSTITSLSVCALVGFRVTMVPWELLLIVIVFVGAENMFNLVDAVTKTSVTLTVTQRIADGLGRGGTSNSLKVLSYNAILGVFAFFSVGAIRQFCVFAIVVLVAHWFLAHTFFMAVLSIDIQRLELQELLNQNASLMTPVAKTVPEAPPSAPDGFWKKLVVTLESLLRGRATKNISLLLLLATTATLYYTTYPASTRLSDPSATLPRGALTRSPPNLGSSQHQSPAWSVWKLLNPEEDPILHLRIELPSILTFRPDVRAGPSSPNSDLFRTLSPLLWLLKIVVLPIALTTTALYGLLLYLLKNAELLEAQRSLSGTAAPRTKEQLSLEDSMSFVTLPRAFSTDVELLAASKDGRIVTSVGMQNELVIWRVASQTHVSIDVTDVLLRTASTSLAPSSLTAVAVDPTGSYCAVGTGAGLVGTWVIEENSVKPLAHLWRNHISSGVEELEFVQTAPPKLHHSPVDKLEANVMLLVTHRNGVAATWTIDLPPSVEYLAPPLPGNVKSAKILRSFEDAPPMVAFAMEDGSLEVVEVAHSEPTISPDYRIQAGNPADLVSLAYACRVELGDTSRLIIGAATEAGVISLWDGCSAECIAILEELHGEIDMLRILPVQAKACNYCGELPLESFSISLSVRHHVLIYTAYIPVQSRRCTCPHNQPHPRSTRDVAVERRSRTNSMSTSSGMRSRTTGHVPNGTGMSASGTDAFPVSGHGVHSRRASEKESFMRRQESFSIPLVMDEHELAHAVGPAESPTMPLASSSLSPRANVGVTVVKRGDMMCERGCWDVWEKKIVGVRRRPRSSAKKNGDVMSVVHAPFHDVRHTEGLTRATLERWELWSFDPSNPCFRGSSLDLLRAPPQCQTMNGEARITAKKHIPRLPFTRASPFVTSPRLILAGFGNTVGMFYVRLKNL